MASKIRLSAVSYLNTKPFIYGLYRSALSDNIELSLDIPSECARKLASGETDLALSPVAIIPSLPQAFIVSDYCIGATGEVKTVCLFSERPLGEIKKIFLDFHSRTSVELTQLLCREYWNIAPEFIPATEGYEKRIGGSTAGLIIGDRTIGKHDHFPYVYDLGEAWMHWTGKPFVFAAWISTRPMNPGFVRDFNLALEQGINHIPELCNILPGIAGFNLEDYFQNNISYQLDDAKWDGLNLFLKHLGSQTQITRLIRQEVLPE